MQRKIPLIFIIVALAIILIDLPLELQKILYSLSITIKSFIIMILPIVILCLIFKTIVGLSHKASKIIGLIFFLVCCSNFCSTFLSHYIGSFVFNFDLFLTKPENLSKLEPLWTLNLPKLISNDIAMISGVILGFIMPKISEKTVQNMSKKIDFYIHKILFSFVYILPIFIAGFIAKLKYDGVIELLLKHYTTIFLIVGFSQFFYIFLLYWLLNQFNIKGCIKNILNMMPSSISAFTTMSSAASMPLAIMGAQRNAENKNMASSVIPATVNIHLIGDCFAIPIFAYAVLKSFGIPEPSLIQYLTFSFYFVLAKFSVAAVPAGGIIVMLPILQDQLGFNTEMISLITALYILFDPVITSANVLGNGAFAKFIDKIVNRTSWKNSLN